MFDAGPVQAAKKLKKAVSALRKGARQVAAGHYDMTNGQRSRRARLPLC